MKFAYSIWLVCCVLVRSQAQDTIAMNDLIMTYEGNHPVWISILTEAKHTGFACNYRPDKSISLIEEFKDGVLLYVKTFHTNGQISSMGYYDDMGLMSGSYSEWDIAGNLITQGAYEKGKMNGPWKYFQAGKLQRTGNYVNDQQQGVWEYYDNTGKMVRKEYYEKDVMVRAEEL